MVTISRAEYESLKAERDELNQKLDWLLEQVRLNRKKLYGVSSERLEEELIGQLSLMFDETEAWLSKRRAKETEVAAHTWRSFRLEEVLPDNVPVEVVEHRIPEKEPDCPVCGTAMMEIGRRDVRRTLVMIPAQVEYCNALFGIEQELAGLPPEERYEQRLARSKPVMDALLAWAETKSAAAPKSALGRALYYLREQWPYLIRFLEDGRLEISNNRAERSVKPFVMGRKNWLFANTEGGAQSSAMIYSLIETAKENGLDPYRYLVHVLTEAPRLAAKGDCWAEKLLPEYVREGCCDVLKRKD